MKRAFLITASVLFLVSGIATIYSIEAAKSDTMTITGTIIDNMCAGLHKTDLANFVKTHTKECALKPPCVESGYSLFHYGTLITFDDESNKKIEQFLKKNESKLAVSAVVKKAGDKYSILSVKNL